MRPASRRLAAVVALFALSLLSCGREVTGPDNGFQYGRPRFAALALDPQMPSLLASLEGAGDVVAFENVWVVLRDSLGAVVFDSLVAFPVGADSISLTVTLPIPINAPEEGLPLNLTMAYVNAAGDTVFRGGPAPVVAAPVGSGTASQPITIPIVYDGVGKNAASVVITPAVDTVVAGTQSTFTAVARDASNAVINGTPLLFYTLDSARASVPNVGSGTVTWLHNRGTARIVAALPDGNRADTSFVHVKLPASKLVLGSGGGQSGTFGVPLANPIVVRTLASDDVPVPGVIVTFAVATGGGSLAALVDTSDANGDVSTSWTLGSTLGGQTITATAAGLAGSPLTITGTATAGAPFRVLITQQPSVATAGQTLSPSVQATVQDNAGNTVTTFTGAVSVVLDTGVAGVLNGTTTRNAVAGIATFDDLSLTAIGIARLIASSGALLADESDSMAVLPGATARLEIIAEPTNTAAGATISPIAVLARDAFGNPTPSFAGNVAISINSGPAGASLGGTLTVAASGGVATFSTVSADKAGAYTLLVSSGALVSDTTASFVIGAAGADSIAIISGDGQTGTVGALLASALQVRVLDTFGNPVAGAEVTFNALNGSVSPDTVITDTNGDATAFWTLGSTAGPQQLDVATAGANATFTATAQPASATKLVIVTPAGTSLTAGVATTALVVHALDAFNNLDASFTGTVAVAIQNGPAGGSINAGATSVSAVNGVATFSGLMFQTAGAYELRITASGLTFVDHPTIVVDAIGAQAMSIVSGDSQTGIAGAALSDSLIVVVTDSFGNPIANHPVTWSVVSGGGSLVLGATNTDAAGRSATTWTLGTTVGPQSAQVDAGVAGTVTFNATATAGAATQLIIDAPPSDTLAAGVAGTAIVISARDANGNVVTDHSGSVTIGFTYNPAGGSIISGSALQSFAGGIATFSGIAIDKVGKYVFDFSSSGLSAAFSDTVTVIAGVADTIELVSGDNQIGEVSTTFAAPLVVQVRDAFGNPVEGDTVHFTLLEGYAGLTLSTMLTDATGHASTEVVAFDSVDVVRVQASVTGASTPVEFTLNIQSSAPTAVLLTDSATTSVAGTIIPSPFTVELRDAQNALATAFTDTVRFVILSGPVGAPAGGKTKAVPIGGVVSFDDLSFNTRGTYQIAIKADGVADSAFATLVVTSATASVMSIQDGDGQSGQILSTLANPLRVLVTDQFGNPTPGVVVTWTVVSGSATAPATSVTDTNGVASSALDIGNTLDPITVDASVSGLSGSPVAFNVTPLAGAAHHLIVSAQGTTVVAGDTITPLTIHAVDTLGNLVTSFGDLVFASVDSGPVGGTILGAVNRNAVGGVVAYDDILFTIAGTYRLKFTSVGLIEAVTTNITVTPGAPNAIALVDGDVQTDTVVRPLDAPMRVRVVDQFNNPIPNYAIAWAVTDGDASFVADTTLTGADGIASAFFTFGDTAGAVTATATATTFAGVVTFNHVSVPDEFAAIEYVTPPDTSVAGQTIPSIDVRARDAYGNTIADVNLLVTVSVFGGGTTINAGTLTTNFGGGTVSFNDLVINEFGTWALQFTSGAINSTPMALTVLPATAASLEFVLQPTTTTAGETIAPVTVRARDAFGNIVSAFDSVTISIDSSAVDAVLTGTLTLSGTSGLAVFNDLRLNRTGVSRLKAEWAGLTAAVSDTFSQSASAPDSIALLDGDAQSASVRSTLANPLRVIVFDTLGNPVPGVNVSWNIQSGFATLDSAIIATDANGISTTGVTLGDSAGAIVVQASQGALAGSPITFNLTATNAPAFRLSIDTAPANAVAGSVLSNIVVSVRDSLSNFAIDYTDNITVAVDSGPVGGTLNGTTTHSTTGAAATFGDLVLNVTGSYRLRFTAPGLPDIVSALFEITPSFAENIVMVSGDAQTDTAGKALDNPLVVRVADGLGNPIAGQWVQWYSPTGGVTLAADSSITDVNGDASMSVTLGGATGNETIEAAVSGLTGSPVVFSATIVHDTLTHIAVMVSPDTTTSGTPTNYYVQALDQYNNIVTSCNCPISVDITSGPSSSFVTGTTSLNFSAGEVNFTDLVFGPIGLYTLRFSTADDTTNFATVVIPGTGASFLLTSGDAQTEMANTTLDLPLTVRIQDANGNGRLGDSVVFTINDGGGLFDNGFAVDTAVTDVNGYASASWTLGSAIGIQNATASSTGFSDLNFVATATEMIANRVWTGAVDTDWSNSGNWKGGFTAQSADSVLVRSGLPNYPVLTTNVPIGRLTLEGTGSIDLNGNVLIVGGRITTPTAFTGLVNGIVHASGTVSTISGAFERLRIYGAYTADGPIVTSDSLFVANGQSLDFGAYTHTIGTHLYVWSGASIAQAAGGVITVNGNAFFDGSNFAAPLAGGTLYVGGDITTQLAGDAFRADSAHLTVLNGTGTQTVNFGSPSNALDMVCDGNCFGQLQINKLPGNGAVIFASNVTAVGGITAVGDSLGASGRVITTGGPSDFQTTVTTAERIRWKDAFDRSSTVFGVDTLVAWGNGGYLRDGESIPTIVVGTRSWTSTSIATTSVIVDGTLDIDGTVIHSGEMTLRNNGRLTMHDANDSLVVGGPFTADSDLGTDTTMTAGTLVLQGHFTQSRNDVVSFRAGAGHTTRFIAPTPTITLNSGVGTYFGSFVVGDGTVATVVGQFEANGDAIIEGTNAATRLTVTNFALLHGDLIDDVGGRWDANDTRFTKNGVSMPTQMDEHVQLFGATWNPSVATTIGGIFNVVEGAQFSPNGVSVTVGGAMTVLDSAIVTLDDAADSLFIAGNFVILGTVNASAGYLNLDAQLDIQSPGVFNGSAGHVTEMGGTSTASISIANPGFGAGQSMLGELRVTKSDGAVLQLLTDVYVGGVLSDNPANQQTINGTPGVVLTSQGAVVNDLVFDWARWTIVDGAQLDTIHNVRFQTQAADATQFYLQRTSGTVVLMNPQWITTPTTGKYLVLDDPNGGGDFTVEVINPTPQYHSGFVDIFGAVQLLGWTDFAALNWTGASSQDWSLAANWLENRVPVATDSVHIANTFTSGQMPQISSPVTVRALVSESSELIGLTSDLTITRRLLLPSATPSLACSGGQLYFSLADSAEFRGQASCATTVAGGTLRVLESATVSGLFIDNGGSLELGAQSMTAYSISIGSTGALRMLDDAGELRVQAGALFGGTNTATDLSAGTLRVSGMIQQTGTAGLASSGTHMTVIDTSAFAPSSTILFAEPSLSLAALTLNAQVSLSSDVNVVGDVTLGEFANVTGAVGLTAGGSLYGAQSSSLTLTRMAIGGVFSDTGTYAVDTTVFTAGSQGIPLDFNEAPVTFKSIRVTGSATMYGTEGNTYTLDGDLIVEGPLTLPESSTVVVRNFQSAGSGVLIMQSGAPHLNVRGNAEFRGGSETNLLTAGMIQVAGDLRQFNTVSTSSYHTMGAHMTVVDSAGTMSFEDPTASPISSLLFASHPAGFVRELATNVSALQVMMNGETGYVSLAISPEASGVTPVITTEALLVDRPASLSNVGLKVTGVIVNNDDIAFSNFGSSTTPQLEVAKDSTLVQAGDVTFDQSQTPALYVRLNDTNAADGQTLSMSFGAVSPAVHGNAVDLIGGAFFTNWADVAEFRWTGAVSSDWTTAGNWATNVVPGTADSVYVPNIVTNAPAIASPTELKTLVSDLVTDTIDVTGTLSITGALVLPRQTSLVCSSGARIEFNASGSTSMAGSMGCQAYVQFGDVLVADSTAVDSMLVENSGRIVITGDTLTINGRFETGGTGRIQMNDANSLVTVYGDAFFNGGSVDGMMNWGRLRLNQSLQANLAGTFMSTNQHTVEFFRDGEGGTPIISFNDPDNTRFNHVEFTDGDRNVLTRMVATGDVTVSSGVDVSGGAGTSLELRNIGTLTVSSGASLALQEVHIPWALVVDGDYSVYNTTFTAANSRTAPALKVGGDTLIYNNVTVTGDWTFAGGALTRYKITGDLTVADSGFARFGGAGATEVIIGGNLMVSDSARVQMNNSSTLLAVNGSVTFGGASEAGLLTQGEISLRGNFVQSGHEESYSAGVSHTTTFNGSSAQGVTFQNPGIGAGASQFGTLRLNAVGDPNSLALNSLVYVNGQIVADSATADFPSTISAASTQYITSFGAHVIGGLTFDNVHWTILNGQPLDTLDALTFTNITTDTLQLRIQREDDVIELVSPTFSTAGTAAFFRAVDGGGVSPLTVNVTNPQPPYHSGRADLQLGAVLNGWPADVQFVWTGEVDTDWLTAGNWSMDTVPTNADSVSIGAGATVRPTIGAKQLLSVASLTNYSDTLPVVLGDSATLAIGNEGDLMLPSGAPGIVCSDSSLVIIGGSGASSAAKGWIDCRVRVAGNGMTVTDSMRVQRELDVWGPVTFASGGATLRVLGEGMTISSGRVEMHNAGDTLDVAGALVVYSAEQTSLTDGLLMLGGNFMQSGYNGNFKAEPGNLTQFFNNGTIYFGNNPDTAGNHFGMVDVQSGTRTLTSRMVAKGTLVINGGANIDSTFVLEVHGNLGGTPGSTLGVREVWVGGNFGFPGNMTAVDTVRFIGSNQEIPFTLGANPIQWENVVVTGSAFMQGTDSIGGYVQVRDGGTLRFGAPDTVSAIVIDKNLVTSTGGRIQMTDTATMVTVNETMDFNGGPTDGLLTEGTLRGRLQFYASDSGFMASGNHKTAMLGCGLCEGSGVPLWMTGDSRFNDLEIWLRYEAQHGLRARNLHLLSGARLDTAAFVYLTGDLTGGSNTSEFHTVSLHIADSLGYDGQFDADTVVLTGTGQRMPARQPDTDLVAYQYVDIRGTARTRMNSGDSLVVANTLMISGGGELEFGETDTLTTVRINGALVTQDSGSIAMHVGTTHVHVMGQAYFGGGSTAGKLDWGHLYFHDTFNQYGVNSTASFQANPAHSTHLMAQASPKYVSFDTQGFGSTDSRFGFLYLDSSVGDTIYTMSGFHSHALLHNTLDTVAVTAFGTDRPRLVTRSVEFYGREVFDKVQLDIRDGQILTGNIRNLALINQEPDSIALRITRQSATLTIDTLQFNTVPTTGKYIEVNDTDAGGDLSVTLDVVQPIFHFGKISVLGGALLTGWDSTGAFVWTGQAGGSFYNAGSWNTGLVPSATDSVVYDSTAVTPLTVDSIATTVGAFKMASPYQTLYLQENLTVTRSLVMPIGDVSCEGATITVNAAGDSTRIQASDLDCPVFITGGVAVVDAASQFGELTVSDSGRLALNGKHLTTTENFTTSGGGTVSMQTALDSLTIGGDAIFTGGSTTGLLTDGTLTVRGNFSVGGSTATAFHATENHLTRFYHQGNEAQPYDISNNWNNTSRFAFVRMDSTERTLQNPMRVDSLLVLGRMGKTFGDTLDAGNGLELHPFSIVDNTVFRLRGTWGVDSGRVLADTVDFLGQTSGEQDIRRANTYVEHQYDVVRILGDARMGQGGGNPYFVSNHIYVDSASLTIAPLTGDGGVGVGATEGTPGSLTVRGATSKLIMPKNAVVRVNNLSFEGGTTNENDLIDGTIWVTGDFYAAAGAFHAGAFIPNGRRHMVVMESDSGSVKFDDPINDRFFDFSINAGSLTLLESDVYLDGQFGAQVAGSGPMTIRGDSTHIVPPRTLYALGGSVLAGVNHTSFRNVALVVNGDGTGGVAEPVALNNLTFAAMYPDATFLTLQNLDGYRDANAIEFDQIAFNSGVTGAGKYFAIDNSDVHLTFTNATPAIGCILSLCAANASEPGTADFATWDGSESSDWFDAGNWVGGVVPSPNTNVIVADQTNDPVIGSNTTIRMLQVMPGANLQVNGATVTVGGDLLVSNFGGTVLGGTGGAIKMTPFGTSSVGMQGTIGLPVSLEPFGNVGSADFQLLDTLTVMGSLHINGGFLDLNNRKAFVFGDSLVLNGAGGLKMDTAGDSLVINNAHFNGAYAGGVLTAGTLDINGGLKIEAGNKFYGGDNHLTISRGNISRTFEMLPNEFSAFDSRLGDLLILESCLPFVIANHLWMNELRVSGNTSVENYGDPYYLFSNGATINSTVTFSNTSVMIDGVDPVDLSTATLNWQSMNSNSNQLEIRRPNGGTVEIGAANFDPVAGTGLFLGTVGPFTLGDTLTVVLNSVTPVGHEMRLAQIGNVKVEGWTELMSTTFLGSVSNDITDPANWLYGLVGGVNDSVVVDNGVNPSNEFFVPSGTVKRYRSLVAAAGATIGVEDSLVVRGTLNLQSASSEYCSGVGTYVVAPTSAEAFVFGLPVVQCGLMVRGSTTTTLVTNSQFNNVWVRNNGLLNLDGSHLVVNNTFQVLDNARLSMDNGTDSLDVGGTAVFNGGNNTGLLTTGTMVLRGDVVIGNPTGSLVTGPDLPVHIGDPTNVATDGRTINGSGDTTSYISWMINHAGTKTIVGQLNVRDSLVMDDTVANAITGAVLRIGIDDNGSQFGMIRARDMAAVTAATVQVYGQYDVGNGFVPDTLELLGTGTADNSGFQVMRAQTVDEDDFEYLTLRIRGGVYYSDQKNTLGAKIARRLEILDEGFLNVGGAEYPVHLRADTATILISGANAQLLMNDDSALVVVDSIHWNTGQMSSLLQGEIQVHGAWVQRNYGGLAGQYAFDPDFRMLFAPGSFTQNRNLIYDAEDPYNAALMNLRVTGSDTVTLASDLVLNGLFKRDGAIDGNVVFRAASLAAGNSRLFRVGMGTGSGGGIDVNASDHPIVFRNVRLQVDGDAAGVVDANMLMWTADMDPDVTAFTLATQGQGPKTFSNIQFQYAIGTGNYFSYDVSSTSGTVTFTNPLPAVGCMILGCNPSDVAPFVAGPNTWEGDNSISWTDPLNWSAGHVPDMNSSVTIPSGTTYSPTIATSQLNVGYLEVQSGATLTFNGFEVLYVRGSLNNAGDIQGTNGLIAMNPAVPSSIEHGFGDFEPKLAIGANLGGAVHEVTVVNSVNLDNSIEVSGRLNLNSNSLYTPGNFTVSTANGLLIMQNASDYLVVGGNVNFSGGANTTGYLTNGEIDVSGNFSKSGTNQFGFSPSGNHLVTLGSNASNSVVTFSNAGAGNSRFNRLNLQKFSGTNVQFQSDVVINSIVAWSNTPISVSNGTVTVVGSMVNPGLNTITLAANGYMTLSDPAFLTACNGYGYLAILGSTGNFYPGNNICVNPAEETFFTEQQGHQNQDSQHWQSLQQYLFKD